MKLLVACEHSQVVTTAFRDEGHEAYSCDVLPTEGKKNWHIQDDVLKHLNDGWDQMIGHPDCTYMCNSGVSWLYKEDDRWEKLREGYEFFLKLKNADIPKIALENPIPHKHAVKYIGRYTQRIQPYQFGHTEQKATCLWLKNLPKLVPTRKVEHEMKKLPKSESQRIHMTPPGEDRWKIRSRTFEGIAKAMAQQWGNKPIQSQLLMEETG